LLLKWLKLILLVLLLLLLSWWSCCFIIVICDSHLLLFVLHQLTRKSWHRITLFIHKPINTCIFFFIHRVSNYICCYCSFNSLQNKQQNQHWKIQIISFPHHAIPTIFSLVFLPLLSVVSILLNPQHLRKFLITSKHGYHISNLFVRRILQPQ